MRGHSVARGGHGSGRDAPGTALRPVCVAPDEGGIEDHVSVADERVRRRAAAACQQLAAVLVDGRGGGTWRLGDGARRDHGDDGLKVEVDRGPDRDVNTTKQVKGMCLGRPTAAAAES